MVQRCTTTCQKLWHNFQQRAISQSRQHSSIEGHLLAKYHCRRQLTRITVWTAARSLHRDCVLGLSVMYGPHTHTDTISSRQRSNYTDPDRPSKYRHVTFQSQCTDIYTRAMSASVKYNTQHTGNTSACFTCLYAVVGDD